MKNKQNLYDIIVIGAGSAGLSISLFMNKVGLKVLLINKSDKEIGGDCLNYGCVPSKALIHISRIMYEAKKAEVFGLTINGKVSMDKVADYIREKQNIIRQHENASYIRNEGVEVVLGKASFAGRNSIKVNDQICTGKRIVLATGSRPRRLNIPGTERVDYYDNESVFELRHLPKRLLIVGGGPIGMEIGEAMSRLGSEVTVVHRGKMIMPHDDEIMAKILYERLKLEGISFILNAKPEKFISSNEAIIKDRNGITTSVHFDAVLAAIGREHELNELELSKAGIKTEKNKIISNKYLQTTNKRVYVCGDIAGNLQFSHAAEQHARILLNNFFSPFKKKLDNSYMSWVTFTDPELATFGLSEKQLKNKSISYKKLEFNFTEDDRAVVDDYTYGKLILYISKESIFAKTKIVGGTMVAPHAGELIQELILMNDAGLSINKLFSKIYPYPVASRVNQHLIAQYKEKSLTPALKRLLRMTYKMFSSR